MPRRLALAATLLMADCGAGPTAPSSGPVPPGRFVSPAAHAGDDQLVFDVTASGAHWLGTWACLFDGRTADPLIMDETGHFEADGVELWQGGTLHVHLSGWLLPDGRLHLVIRSSTDSRLYMLVRDGPIFPPGGQC